MYWREVLDVSSWTSKKTVLIFVIKHKQVNGPAKLIVWDMVNNCTVRSFEFSDDVLPYNSSWANDIVLDETNGFAYITDVGGLGGIVVKRALFLFRVLCFLLCFCAYLCYVCAASQQQPANNMMRLPAWAEQYSRKPCYCS